MSQELPTEGAASDALARRSHEWWADNAAKTGIDVSRFDHQAPLETRLSWALSLGLLIGTALSRFSTELQHSTESQIREIMCFAARAGIYIPPEYLCVDEGETGRRMGRDGLDRTKAILNGKLATVLLVFKVSRLLRVAYKSFQFVNDHVVEKGLRAISVSQGIDTRDEKTWKALMYLHGMLDDMLLDTIADHCRAGITSLFLDGYVTGALTLGYVGEVVPGAPLTNRGRPRKKPVIAEAVGKLIVQHFEWIRDGMSIREGWCRWVAAGGPCDPRSTTKTMSYSAYRRMLSNRRYTGLWAFGRRRNRWSSSLDYSIQVDQPETEVKFFQCEELRIVSDELFFEVQKVLEPHKKGPRGPRKHKPAQLWDLTTGLFYCAACSTPDDLVRFYQTGAQGRGMGCKRGKLCACHSAVRRKEAVLAICAALLQRLSADQPLVDEVVRRAVELDQQPDSGRETGILELQRRIRLTTARISDLADLAGEGSEADRKEMKAKVRQQQIGRGLLVSELSRLKDNSVRKSKYLTPDGGRKIAENIRTAFESAARGDLGPDLVHKAFAIFKRLVGDRIMVTVERRAGRKQTSVRAVFHCLLLEVVQRELGVDDPESPPAPELSVWLRKPPRIDLMAERVHELVDIQKLSLRQAADQLCQEEYQVNSGHVWYAYRRYYEMRGLPTPDLPYNNGNQRDAS